MLLALLAMACLLNAGVCFDLKLHKPIDDAHGLHGSHARLLLRYVLPAPPASVNSSQPQPRHCYHACCQAMTSPCTIPLGYWTVL